MRLWETVTEIGTHMISEYVLFATLIFYPGNNSTPDTTADRIMSIRRSYATYDECLAGLKSRVADHILITGSPGLRPNTADGVVCKLMDIEFSYTEAVDLEWRAKYKKIQEEGIRSREILNNTR